MAANRRDHRVTSGRDRLAYMKHKLGEAMHDSAIRVSLTARLDGTIAGFVMARVDLGDELAPRVHLLGGHVSG